MVHNAKILRLARDELVFKHSLLRTINFATITEQFKRILDGGATLTEFHFGYKVTETSDRAGFNLRFDVLPNVRPSRNVHVLIGRNGVGKTTLLNGMITALVERKPPRSAGRFTDLSDENGATITDGYFAGLVSVSFSAFDPFTPPPDIDDAAAGDLRYSYIGLKNIVVNPDGTRRSEHKGLRTFAEDFGESLLACFGSSDKTERWKDAIHYLESDLNFADMDLCRFLEIKDSDLLSRRARKAFEKMSSGHAMVLLTITKLVEKTGEKTLVIIDEPESHLHPPLLSAFIRSLSELLNRTNGVAIIATHSPVVLQEVPKSCAWKLYRTRLNASTERPEQETFGENVGVLTRDVFGLEAAKSGFHNLLTESVSEGKDYDQILEDYGEQLGFEGRALLRALVANRNKEQGVV